MSARSRKLVVGNWKMNGVRASAETLLPEIVTATREAPSDLAICVPFQLLETASRLLLNTQISLGAQDVSDQERGAYTGQVSATMLHDFGCRFVIVGHSERRTLLEESDRLVARKARAALSHGLIPILCVGETLGERESGETEDVIRRQLDALLDLIGPEDIRRCVVAYEPVWAIGTGRTATPDQAQSIHAAIRERIALVSASAASEMRILYGGSVGPATAKALFGQSDIDGALVGGASLVAQDLAAIARAGV